jgi:hypothetical protein
LVLLIGFEDFTTLSGRSRQTLATGLFAALPEREASVFSDAQPTSLLAF